MERFDDLVSCENVVLVGAGQLGRMAIQLWPKNRSLPIFFLDSIKSGFVEGIPIRSLIDYRPQSSVVYALSAFKSISSMEVISLYRDIFGQEIITVYDIFQRYIPDEFSNGWGYHEKNALNQHKLSIILGNIVDSMSIASIASVFEWRYGRTLLPDFPIEPEQLKFDIQRFQNPSYDYDVVIDAGCYDLGMYENFTERRIQFGSYIAFEPDLASYAVCKQRVALLGVSDVTLEQFAIGGEDAVLPFLSNRGFSSRLVHSSTEICQTRSIDSYLRENHTRLTNGARVLIKLHTEGAELDGVRGCLETISKHSVDFIISLAHTEQSFLEIIPLLSKQSRYNFFLRSSSLFGDGLYLYALRA